MAIVVVVLLFFMGVRSGLLIGFILVVTISGSFIVMAAQQISLERISLGALIIALGMLVDNAIVVVDGMLIGLQQGRKPEEAAVDVVEKTSWPLLGATLVAILAFAAIGTSQDSTGEYCRSLFQVISISLGLSWVTAVTVTPLLGVMFLKAPAGDPGDAADPYGGGFYRVFRGGLRGAIRFRWVTVTITLAIFAASLWGFGRIEQSFFPDSTRPQFMVDYYLPQGTHIEETARDAVQIEQYIQGLDGVNHVASIVGKGALRFLLTYIPEKSNSAYAQFLVEVDDYRTLNALMEQIQTHVETEYPHSVPTVRRFMLGPGEPGKIQARISGADADVLRQLAGRVEAIMLAEPDAFGIRIDWRERVKVVRPVLAEEAANAAGITRQAVSALLLQAFEGARVGVYREGDDLLPIVARASEAERSDIASANNLQIWSPAGARFIPLRQVVSRFDTAFEDDIIVRQDRKRTITVIADPRRGNANVLFNSIRAQADAIEMPFGYELEWWGEYKSSGEAQAGPRREPALVPRPHGADRDHAVQRHPATADHLAVCAAGADRSHCRAAGNRPALRFHGAARLP